MFVYFHHSNKTMILFLYFIVSIESAGALPPDQLYVDAIKLLMSKCDRLLQEVDGNTNN